jgi:Domain of unknown function (DUF4265)
MIGLIVEAHEVQMTGSLIKILFDLDESDWHGHGSESLWAEPVAGNEAPIFQIRNSPFFAIGINHLDVVRGKPSGHDRVYEFVEVIERGGHSTYMLLMQPGDSRINACWSRLELLGCTYESTTKTFSRGRRLLYSVDVPSTSDIYEVYEVLEGGLREGVWDFQEGYASLPEPRTNIQQS